MSTKCPISIIIPTIERITDLQICLNSILAQSVLPEEIIIVDQSEQNTIELFFDKWSREHSSKVGTKYFRVQDKSLTRAKNFGKSKISQSCKYVAFLDDDVELTPSFLKEVFSFFQTQSQYGVLSANILLNETTAPIKKILNFFWHLYSRFFMLDSNGDGHIRSNGMPTYLTKLNPNEIKTVQTISGGASIFKKEITEVFFFDENLKGYCSMEDVDAGHRLCKKWLCAKSESPKLWHHVSPVNRQKVNYATSQFVQNYSYLFKKNSPQTTQNIIIFLWSLIGLLGRYIMLSVLKNNPRYFLGYISGLLKIISNRYDTLYEEGK